MIHSQVTNVSCIILEVYFPEGKSPPPPGDVINHTKVNKKGDKKLEHGAPKTKKMKKKGKKKNKKKKKISKSRRTDEL